MAISLSKLIPDDPSFQPDDKLRKFIEDYAATNGRMYQDDRGTDTPPSESSILPPIRPKYYGRKRGQRLAQARAERLMTQTTLAKLTGTTRRGITEIEAGRREPSVYLAMAIAQALEMQVEDIFLLPPLSPVPPSRH